MEAQITQSACGANTRLAKPASTERTKRLKDRAISVLPELCPERGAIVTEVYKNTEGEPQIIRRAKAFKEVLERMTIYIREGELVVGNEVSTPRGGAFFPETTSIWVDEELDTFENRSVDRFVTSSETKRIIREVLPYWKGKTVEDRARAIMPDQTRDLMDFQYPVFSPQNMLTNMVGHIIVDYEKLVNIGLNRISERIEEKLKELDPSNPDNMRKILFYKAERTVCDAAVAYARRYSQLATELAQKEANGTSRKAELERIAEICEWVPANPARNFYEGIQSYLFVHILGHFETDAQAISTGRLDQILYPLYKRDKEEGILNQEQALELLECFYIKNFELNHLFDLECATYFAGYSITENLMLGGQDRNGNDATNELSYLCLEAESRMKLTQPALSVRVHKDSPREFLVKACEVVSMGGGKPSFFSDSVAIDQLLSDGVSLEDARNYAIVGCVEATSIGNTYGWTNAAMFNLGKCLELALNQGRCRLSGRQVGPKTKDPRAFASFDEVIEALRVQVAYFVKHMVISLNAIDLAHGELCQLPFLSLLVDDAIEKGEDISRGGARYNFTGPQAVGLSDVADSLIAIKELVFDKRSLSVADLTEALDSDFEGNEELRSMLINRNPKYGNGIDSVDALAKQVGLIYCEEVGKYKNPRGGPYRPGIYPVSANTPLGMRVGALPSGRKARVPLADGISPSHGSDQKGPTAVLRSAAKLDHVRATNGTQLNQWLTPGLLQDEKGIQCFADLIGGYFEHGGFHVQFNVVSKDTLLDAQKNPDAYRSLLVRVAGYSAYFTELSEPLQNDIIGRTEQLRF
jgi:formate C-acetyltransferase